MSFFFFIKFLDREILNRFSFLYFFSDEQSKDIFTQTDNIEQISNLLTHTNLEISLNALTTLVFLINEETKSKICCADNLTTILNLSESDNDRLKVLATLFLEDYCTKEELDFIKK